MSGATAAAGLLRAAQGASAPVAQAKRAALLTLAGVGKSFGGVKALEAIDLAVAPGEIRAIIGPNGAGKSTLINLISGLQRPDRGSVSMGGESLRASRLARLGVARTFQNLALFEGLSVAANVAMGRTALRRASTPERILGLGRIRREREATRAKVDEILAFLDLAEHRDRPIGGLPYGLRKRVEFARAIVAEPRLLLLDEPMAGTGIADKEKLATFVRATRDTYGTTILLIEHDIGIVMRLADRIAVLDHGRKIADGLPEAVRRDRAVIEAYLGVEDEAEAA